MVILFELLLLLLVLLLLLWLLVLVRVLCAGKRGAALQRTDQAAALGQEFTNEGGGVFKRVWGGVKMALSAKEMGKTKNGKGKKKKKNHDATRYLYSISRNAVQDSSATKRLIRSDALSLRSACHCSRSSCCSCSSCCRDCCGTCGSPCGTCCCCDCGS